MRLARPISLYITAFIKHVMMTEQLHMIKSESMRQTALGDSTYILLIYGI